MLLYNRIFISLFIILCSALSNAQVKETKRTFWNDVQFGGSVGLNFGDGFFIATLAPSAIYNLNDYVSLGAGLNATINNPPKLPKTRGKREKSH